MGLDYEEMARHTLFDCSGDPQRDPAECEVRFPRAEQDPDLNPNAWVLPQCGDAVWGFLKNLAADALIPIKFVRGVGRVGQAGYLLIKYGPRARALASGYRVLGLAEAGLATAVYAAGLPENPGLYDFAKATPILGSGLKLGEAIVSCGNLLAAHERME